MTALALLCTLLTLLLASALAGCSYLVCKRLEIEVRFLRRDVLNLSARLEAKECFDKANHHDCTADAAQ